MIGLLQRVQSASVTVEGKMIAAIGAGILLLVGVQKGDTEREATRLLERVLGFRIFPDAEGKMNFSLRQTGGGLLLVPQFTLAADTKKGARPGLNSWRSVPPGSIPRLPAAASRPTCRWRSSMMVRRHSGWKPARRHERSHAPGDCLEGFCINGSLPCCFSLGLTIGRCFWGIKGSVQQPCRNVRQQSAGKLSRHKSVCS